MEYGNQSQAGAVDAAMSSGSRSGDQAMAEHFRQLRQRVRKQHADVLEHQGKHSEALRLLATQ